MCKLTGLLSAIVLLPVSAFATQNCDTEAGWASRQIVGSIQSNVAFFHEAGSQTFSLAPTQYGWRIEMLDHDGIALPVFAVPMRPVETNPVNISGWHFRNGANTGPNLGDVNAPQNQRRFTFGTLAIRPSANPEQESADTVEGFGGLGELVILDFSLSPIEEGQRAVMTSLDFSVCLVWQGGGDRLNPIVDVDPDVAFETAVSTMRGCGLDTGIYTPSDRMSHGREGSNNPFLEPDMDGDNIPDLVLPVTRKSDNAPGLAICLLGDESLVLAGFDGRIGLHLDPVYFDRVDWWNIHLGRVSQSAQEGTPPELTAEAVLMGKDDSSSVLVYLDQTHAVSSYWQGD